MQHLKYFTTKFMKKILILPENVANQIAAGEVVQRPASVVKELMENAIDSGASEIKVNIVNAGKTSIQIIDNGHGIEKDQLKLAFIRHATSKLNNADDLFTLITMGFRGEALASICAISQVNLKSRTNYSEETYQITLDENKEGEITNSVGTVGTTITVKNLFYNVPARRQFLKSEPIEFKYISEAFTRIAIANPKIKFILKHNNKEEAQFEPENLRQRISHVLGKRINENLVPVEESTEVVSIDGFVLRPNNAKKSKGNQYLYVNNRPIKSNYLHKSIIEAFEGLVAPNMHPLYVLKLRVPEDRVDVNVHPAKTEVQFEDERTIYKILCSAVKRSLGIHQISPPIDFENNLDQHISLQSSKALSTPKIKVNSDFNPFNFETQKAKTSTEIFFQSNDKSEQKPIEFSSSWDESESNSNSSKSSFFLPPNYIVTSLKSSLVIINIKRAKKRILFDQLFSALTGDSQLSGQSWVFSEKIDFNHNSNIEIWDMQLKKMGFHWNKQESQFVFTAGPLFLNQSESISWLETIIQQDPNDDIYKDLALSWLSNSKNKYSAMIDSNITDIVDTLFQCKNPWTDPYNKPVTRILDSKTLSAQFN
jgi:DNA mismatch repair protein MutL